MICNPLDSIALEVVALALHLSESLLVQIQKVLSSFALLLCLLYTNPFVSTSWGLPYWLVVNFATSNLVSANKFKILLIKARKKGALFARVLCMSNKIYSNNCKIWKLLLNSKISNWILELFFRRRMWMFVYIFCDKKSLSLNPAKTSWFFMLRTSPVDNSLAGICFMPVVNISCLIHKLSMAFGTLDKLCHIQFNIRIQLI